MEIQVGLTTPPFSNHPAYGLGTKAVRLRVDSWHHSSLGVEV